MKPRTRYWVAQSVAIVASLFLTYALAVVLEEGLHVVTAVVVAAPVSWALVVETRQLAAKFAPFAPARRCKESVSSHPTTPRKTP